VQGFNPIQRSLI